MNNPNHTTLDPLTREERAIKLIIKTVAVHHGFTPQGLLGPGRPLKLARPRQIAMFLTRELTGESFPKIAVAFGGKDHGTIMHACKVIPLKMQRESNVNVTVVALRAQCRHLLEKEGLS